MAKERLSMRKIKEVLRLKCDQNLSNRQVARSCSISRTTVGEYLRRAKEAGLSWPLPDDLDDAAVENLLFPDAQNSSRGTSCRKCLTFNKDKEV